MRSMTLEVGKRPFSNNHTPTPKTQTHTPPLTNATPLQPKEGRATAGAYDDKI